MTVLAEKNGKTYVATTIEAAPEFAAPFGGESFPCLLWDHQGRSTSSDRSVLAKALLESGCRYAVCAGAACEAWHDAIDLAFVTAHLGDPEQVVDAVHVMTSWHQRESADDIAFFFVLNTNFDAHEFDRYLVLHLGTSAARSEVDAAVRKYALGEASDQAV
jgi:hypothetical protein